jgi:hypothetical protein
VEQLRVAVVAVVVAVVAVVVVVGRSLCRSWVWPGLGQCRQRRPPLPCQPLRHPRLIAVRRHVPLRLR